MTNPIENFAHTPDLTDALSDVLTSVRFTGGHIEAHVSCSSEEITFGRGERSMLIIRRGTLLLRCKDAGPDPIELHEGDVVLLAFGSDFSVSPFPMTAEGGEWLRGTFHLDERLSGRLLSCLPTVMILRRVKHGVMDWLETASRFALSEIEMREPGGAVMISRIMELLLIRVLRLWALEPTAQASWLSGAADTAIGRALSLMHFAPEKAWSVSELANAACLSRSVFAARFVALVGLPPLRYLIGLRLDKAAELLQRTKRSIADVAEDTGYTSEAAFSRAFKLRFGSSPSHWRRR
ncbi:AraC family transcriptional regulator [Serratia marcescens]|uniref:AraC family transcriptional regulator n=1 Tax=Serratia marcescens TaxID=615 RepID=UPI003988EA78